METTHVKHKPISVLGFIYDPCIPHQAPSHKDQPSSLTAAFQLGSPSTKGKVLELCAMASHTSLRQHPSTVFQDPSNLLPASPHHHPHQSIQQVILRTFPKPNLDDVFPPTLQP